MPENGYNKGKLKLMEDNFYIQLKNQLNFPQTALFSGCGDRFKSYDCWNYTSFRILICEMVYQAVNLFSEIEEYNIICTSGKFVATIQLGIYSDNVVAKLTNGEYYCDISKIDIVRLYVANRTNFPENDKIDKIVQVLYYNTFLEPVISSSMLFINKSMNKY